MQFHNWHFSWLIDAVYEDGAGLLLGAVCTRVSYLPESRWLYSLRIFLVLWKLEILWKTGIMPE